MEQFKKMKLHPKRETGWVNVYRDDDGTLILGAVHDTKEGAMRINQSLIYVDTIKIEWEE